MTRKIGLLHSGRKDMFTDPIAKLKSALPADVELVEDYYAEDDIGKLEDDADDLVADSDILLIVAAGGPQSAIAAKNATAVVSDIPNRKPVVFTTVFDPVQSGLVDSLATPVGNLTGMAGQTSELDPKRLAILKDFMSQVQWPTNKIGVLMNPDRDNLEKQFKALAAKAKGLGLQPVARRTNDEKMGIKRAFSHFKKKNVLGAVVTADSFFNNNRDEVIAAAAQAGVPTIYQWREFANAGGLISYGPSLLDAYEQAGKYVGRILDNNESPSTLPCSTPDPKGFELVVNGATAAKLRLTVPKTIDNIPVIEI
jgi:putative tryptophan/tyrosine transport system substrate-binding protein